MKKKCFIQDLPKQLELLGRMVQGATQHQRFIILCSPLLPFVMFVALNLNVNKFDFMI